MEQIRWEEEEVCGSSAIAPPPAPHEAPAAAQPNPAAHHCDVPVAAATTSSASGAAHHHHHHHRHHSARRLATTASKQSSSTRIVLFVLSTMATAFRLKARETDSVAKLKLRIAHATGIPVWSQALVVREMELADNSGMTLREHGLRSGCTVTLVVRAQAGPVQFAAVPQLMECTLTVEQVEHLLKQSSDIQLHDVQHSPDLVPALAQIGDRQVLVMFHPRTGTIAGVPTTRAPSSDDTLAASVPQTTTPTSTASAADKEAENTKMRDAMASVRARLARAKLHSSKAERSEVELSSSAASSAVDLPTALTTTTTTSLYDHLMPLDDDNDDDDDDLNQHLSMHDDSEDELDTARRRALSVRRPSTPEPVMTKMHSSKPRCMCCQKKMSALEAMMPCRCSGAYCREHRIAHACPYNYKTM